MTHNKTNIKELHQNPGEIALAIKNCLLELTEIVIHENELLEKLQIDEVLQIIPIKLQVLEQLESLEERIKSKNPLLKLDPIEKQALINTHLNLCKLLHVNHTKLSIAQSINQQIVELISDKFVENKRQDQIYNSAGKISIAEENPKYMPSLTLNQKV